MTSSFASSVVSEEAETSLALIGFTLGAHRNAVEVLLESSTLERLGAAAEGRHGMQCQATFLRLLSVAEAFSAERLLRAVEDSIKPEGNDMLEQIWTKAAVTAVSGWAKQKEAYKRWLKLNLTGLWTSIEDLAVVRNAIAHGLGSLTRQQLRNRSAVDASLGRLSVSVIGERVIVNDDSVARAAKLCREFIETIDLAVSGRPAT